MFFFHRIVILTYILVHKLERLIFSSVTSIKYDSKFAVYLPQMVNSRRFLRKKTKIRTEKCFWTIRFIKMT